jgi:arginine N-succinyltransferase
MILLREVQDRDFEALRAFADTPGMYNLPDDQELLRERIDLSKKSFSSPAGKEPPFSDRMYIFVAEDLSSGKVLGTSMAASQHGTERNPNFHFEVGNEKRFSSTINTGFIHGTLTLKYDTDGPSEIGGLVIDPEYRNTPERVGRQISFVRFLYVARNPRRFRERVVAELLPPLNKKGQSPLWEAIGRRFTNMDYWEADRLCQKNKEFILSLFPEGKIYTTFFSAEARNAIGKVGRQTEPVFHMLTKIGFEYKNQVDPFDGGPHLVGDTFKLLPIRKAREATYNGPLGASSEGGVRMHGLACRAAEEAGRFRAVAVEAEVDGDSARLARGGEIEETLGLTRGERIVFMPYY